MKCSICDRPVPVRPGHAFTPVSHVCVPEGELVTEVLRDSSERREFFHTYMYCGGIVLRGWADQEANLMEMDLPVSEEEFSGYVDVEVLPNGSAVGTFVWE